MTTIFGNSKHYSTEEALMNQQIYAWDIHLNLQWFIIDKKDGPAAIIIEMCPWSYETNAFKGHQIKK